MNFYLPTLRMILATTFCQVTALAGTVPLVPPYPPRTFGPCSLKNVNWASCAVGHLDCRCGTRLLVYRTGWGISILSVIGNTTSAVLPVGVGPLFFHERLSVPSSQFHHPGFRHQILPSPTLVPLPSRQLEARVLIQMPRRFQLALRP